MTSWYIDDLSSVPKEKFGRHTISFRFPMHCFGEVRFEVRLTKCLRMFPKSQESYFVVS